MSQNETLHLAQEFLGRMGSGAEPAEIATNQHERKRCLAATSTVDLEGRAAGKFSGRDANQSPCAAVPVESRGSRDSSKSNAVRCHARKSSHSLRDAAAARGASWHFDDRLFRIGSELRQRFFTSKFEDTLNRAGQVTQRLWTSLALARRFRHFRAGGNKIFVPLLNDGRELIFHRHTLASPRLMGNS